MLPNALNQYVKKAGIAIFWIASLALTLGLLHTFANNQALATSQLQVATPTPGQWSKQSTPAPIGTPDFTLNTADTGQTYLVFLPLIFRNPILPINPPGIFGPVVDPQNPSLAILSADVEILTVTTNLTIPIIVDPGGPCNPFEFYPVAPNPLCPPPPPDEACQPGDTREECEECNQNPDSENCILPNPELEPTPRPTATPVIVPGGDFDNGDNGYSPGDGLKGWREVSSNQPPLPQFFDDDCEDCAVPRGGAFNDDWAGWLGGLDNETSYIYKQFEVPERVDPDTGDYAETKRYFLAFQGKRQSYDSVCAEDFYQNIVSPSLDEQVAGILYYVDTRGYDPSNNQPNNYGVDVGGIIVCQNNPGVTQPSCANNDIQTTPNGKLARFVVAFELCEEPDGSGWDTFKFPLETPGSASTDWTGYLGDPPDASSLPNGPVNLGGETITVIIKVVNDGQLSSSFVVDNVRFEGGPPLPEEEDD